MHIKSGLCQQARTNYSILNIHFSILRTTLNILTIFRRKQKQRNKSAYYLIITSFSQLLSAFTLITAM